MHDTIETVVKYAPAPTAGGLILLGITLQDWVLVGSGILIGLQIFFLVRDKLYRPWRASLNVPRQPDA